jgi:hypothetical protein
MHWKSEVDPSIAHLDQERREHLCPLLELQVIGRKEKLRRRRRREDF